MIIFTIIMFITLLICYIIAKYKLPSKYKFIRWVIIAVPIVILGIIFAFKGIKVIDQTEVGVVKIFGKVDHTISSGLNFVNPISSSVELMDLRIHVRESQFASYTKDAHPSNRLY